MSFITNYSTSGLLKEHSLNNNENHRSALSSIFHNILLFFLVFSVIDLFNCSSDGLDSESPSVTSTCNRDSNISFFFSRMDTCSTDRIDSIRDCSLDRDDHFKFLLESSGQTIRRHVLATMGMDSSFALGEYFLNLDSNSHMNDLNNILNLRNRFPNAPESESLMYLVMIFFEHLDSLQIDSLLSTQKLSLSMIFSATKELIAVNNFFSSKEGFFKEMDYVPCPHFDLTLPSPPNLLLGESFVPAFRIRPSAFVSPKVLHNSHSDTIWSFFTDPSNQWMIDNYRDSDLGLFEFLSKIRASQSIIPNELYPIIDTFQKISDCQFSYNLNMFIKIQVSEYPRDPVVHTHSYSSSSSRDERDLFYSLSLYGSPTLFFPNTELTVEQFQSHMITFKYPFIPKASDLSIDFAGHPILTSGYIPHASGAGRRIVAILGFAYIG